MCAHRDIFVAVAAQGGADQAPALLDETARRLAMPTRARRRRSRAHPDCRRLHRASSPSRHAAPSTPRSCSRGPHQYPALEVMRSSRTLAIQPHDRHGAGLIPRLHSWQVARGAGRRCREWATAAIGTARRALVCGPRHNRGRPARPCDHRRRRRNRRLHGPGSELVGRRPGWASTGVDRPNAAPTGRLIGHRTNSPMKSGLSNSRNRSRPTPSRVYSRELAPHPWYPFSARIELA